MVKKISISVRSLVEFVLRAGDIDMRFTGGERMLDGAKAHRRLQKASPQEYAPEVTLSYTFDYKGFAVTLSGRADGVITEPDGIVVDEIKSITGSLDDIEEDRNPLHWAQAKCYAFILARQQALKSVTVQLTYCSLENDDLKRFRQIFSENELTVFIHDLFDRYIIWAEYESERVLERDAGIKALDFPFASYRKGQRELAAAAYRAIASGNTLFAQAPTGIGKTISTLFPAIKAIGEGHAQKIFYLTAKTITRQAAQDALLKMGSLNPYFKAITLTAKDKICPHPGTLCNPDACEFAKGYYDRVNDALFELLSRESMITRETVQEYASRHDLCPFEFGLDISQWVDCIICDYNYVFDPIVYLRRFFLNTTGDYVFLIDEAHNLVDRAREMYSASLSKSAFLKISKTIKDKNKALAKTAREINRHFIKLRKSCIEAGENFIITKEEDKELYKLLNGFTHQTERWLMKPHPQDNSDELLELYFDCLAFIKISSFYDDSYVTFVKSEANEVNTRLFCLDPAINLSAMLACGKSAVFFSATLSPLQYFSSILGGSSESRLVKLTSPFERSNLCLLIADNISTKYKDRNESTGTVAAMINELVSGKQGNYIVYFPSYRYMNDVYDAFIEICPENLHTVKQEPQMTEQEREAFLAGFEPEPTSTLAGFCVLGGVFSEGIDLAGERLIGSVIVGVGLPQLNPEQNIIRDYFSAKNGMGYEYAYMYPGMNKVLQAAGRVIRSADDRGVVLLIDDRFTRRDYRALFPAHWSHYKRIHSANALKGELAAFWSNEG